MKSHYVLINKLTKTINVENLPLLQQLFPLIVIRLSKNVKINKKLKIDLSLLVFTFTIKKDLDSKRAFKIKVRLDVRYNSLEREYRRG